MGTRPAIGGQESYGDGGQGLDVLILGAGFPRNMKGYGPFALIPLPGGEKVLDRQVRLIREAYPMCQVVFVGGFGAEEVFKSVPPGVICVENEMYEDFAIGRSLELGLRACVRKRLLLIYGDLVFDDNLIQGLPKSGSFAVGGVASGRGRDVGISDEDGQIRLFNYSIQSPKWVQMLSLEGKELTAFKQFAPSFREKLTHEILNQLIREGGSIQTHLTSGPLWEIDCEADWLKMKEEMA